MSSPPNHESQSHVLSYLIQLASELFMTVISHLSNRDIKNLRLTCKTLCHKAPLRLGRVFLSANPRNIEVFRAIADHETFRKGIVEIVWDDARFVYDIPRQYDSMHLPLGGSPTPTPTPLEGCPRWFARACRQNIEGSPIISKENEMLPHEISWDYYQQLLLQQEDVLASEADISALRYGLERFLSLRRVTITPAAHGLLGAPLYETPMIRSFPGGFNYAIPRTWTLRSTYSEEETYELPSWDDGSEKSIWRGFCILIHELTKRDHHALELILDVNQLHTGLNCRIFDQPCDDYNNLVTLLQRPGFRRLDLSLHCDGQYYGDTDQTWSSFRSGYLKHALGETTDLLHFSIFTQVDFALIDSLEFPAHLIPLCTIFPVDKWQKLQHFGLSNFIVKQDDLLSFLTMLPTTLRSVELNFLKFSGYENYNNLLLEMRNTLGWRERSRSERPIVTIHVETDYNSLARYCCLDDYVNEFLYGDGTNPFHPDGNVAPIWSLGTVIERNSFEPTMHTNNYRLCQEPRRVT